MPKLHSTVSCNNCIHKEICVPFRRITQAVTSELCIRDYDDEICVTVAKKCSIYHKGESNGL